MHLISAQCWRLPLVNSGASTVNGGRPGSHPAPSLLSPLHAVLPCLSPSTPRPPTGRRAHLRRAAVYEPEDCGARRNAWELKTAASPPGQREVFRRGAGHRVRSPARFLNGALAAPRRAPAARSALWDGVWVAGTHCRRCLTQRESVAIGRRIDSGR